MSRRKKQEQRPNFLQQMFDEISRVLSGLSSSRQTSQSKPLEGMARGSTPVGVEIEAEEEPVEHIPAQGFMAEEPQPDQQFSQEAAPEEPITLKTVRPARRARQKNSQPSRFWPAFWTITGTVSILLNIVLLAGLLFVGRQLFVIKALVSDDLLSGLYENFVLMDNATISTEVAVSKDIPVTFDLPIEQDLVVTLTQNTSIYGANVSLNSGGVIINSPADIVLPVGQQLPIHLSMSVPVSVTVPVDLNVPVSIPLSSTELHEPFVGLRSVIGEFYDGTLPEIKSPQDLAFCQKFPDLCEMYFK